MRRSYLLALGALCASLCAIAPLGAPLRAAPGAANAWVFLGARNLASGSNRETVQVTTARHLRQLQLCAFNASLQLDTVSIAFDDGKRQDVSVQQRVAAGSCTRALDLASAPRHVRAVELHYRGLSRFRRVPMVRVVGR